MASRIDLRALRAAWAAAADRAPRSINRKTARALAKHLRTGRGEGGLDPRVLAGLQSFALGDPVRIHGRMVDSRAIGALFVAGFVFYGVGFQLVNSVTDEDEFLSTLSEKEATLLLGSLLMFMNTFVDVGKGVLFSRVIEGHSRRTALGYTAALIGQVLLLDLGVLSLMLLVPLARMAGEPGGPMPEWAETLGLRLKDSNTVAYNLGQAILSLGGVMLCALLWQSGLVPRPLAGLGLIGYVAHATGSIAEVYGIPIGRFLLIPGAIFEVGLAGWLFTKGFGPDAYTKGIQRPDFA